MKKTKLCTVCNKEKSVDNFYKNSKSKDGLGHRCKNCFKLYYKNNRELINARSLIRYKNIVDSDISTEQRDILRERVRKYRKTKQYYINKKKWEDNNKIKHKAHLAIANAVRRGKIIKPSECSICKKNNCLIHGHHKDYNEPLDVIWCCKECHDKIHREIKKHQKEVNYGK